MADTTPTGDEARIRRELAAVFRWSARLGMNEAVANHFSTVVGDGTQFLLNPAGRHFTRMTASDLLLLNTNECRHRPRGHGRRHHGLAPARSRARSRSACPGDPAHPHAVHDHPGVPRRLRVPDARPDRLPLPRTGGLRPRLRRHVHGCERGRPRHRPAPTDASVLLLGNHGVMVVADTVAMAWDELYFEQAPVQLQVLALSTGRPLAVLDEAIAAATAKQWHNYPHKPGRRAPGRADGDPRRDRARVRPR